MVFLLSNKKNIYLKLSKFLLLLTIIILILINNLIYLKPKIQEMVYNRFHCKINFTAIDLGIFNGLSLKLNNFSVNFLNSNINAREIIIKFSPSQLLVGNIIPQALIAKNISFNRINNNFAVTYLSANIKKNNASYNFNSSFILKNNINGSFIFNVKPNLHNILDYNGQINFIAIPLANLIDLLHWQKKDIISGMLDLSFNFKKNSDIKQDLLRNLSGIGNYKIYAGKINLNAIESFIIEQVQVYLQKKGLDVDLLRFKKKSASYIDFNSQQGNFTLFKEKMILNHNIIADTGDLRLHPIIKINDGVLSGKIFFIPSQELLQSYLFKGQNFSSILGNNKLQLNMILGGTLSSPTFTLDLPGLEKIINKKVKEHLDDNLAVTIDKLKENYEVKKFLRIIKKL